MVSLVEEGKKSATGFTQTNHPRTLEKAGSGDDTIFCNPEIAKEVKSEG